MSFIGFSEQSTFNDDFDTLDTDVWKQCRDNDGNLYKSGTVSDGKLIFTIEKEGAPRCLLSTEGSFSQAFQRGYGNAENRLGQCLVFYDRQ